MITLEEKLEKTKEEVNCPLGAMKIEKDEAFCVCPITLYRKPIGQVSLGSIPDDIKTHCGSCQIKLKKATKDEIKLLEINEFHEVQCPIQMSSTPAIECAKCPYFNWKLINDLEKSGGDVNQVKHISCGYPNINPDNLKVHLDAKQRKALKEEKTRMRLVAEATEAA